MPYKISERPQIGQICVINANTGETQHCYPNTPQGRKQAKKLLYALRINVPDVPMSLAGRIRFPWQSPPNKSTDE